MADGAKGSGGGSAPLSFRENSPTVAAYVSVALSTIARMTTATALSAEQVRRHRVRVQQLDRRAGSLADTAVLDIGVQDTGTDGALWALALRGVDVTASSWPALADELAMLWSVRGAPHAYRRADLPQVAAALAPYSEADAGKRIFDASTALRKAGIGNLEGLDTVAAAMRRLVTKPTVKGDLSGGLAEALDPPYLRWCVPCQATHSYEQTFRLAAVRAGLELQPGTSPPVLQRITGLRGAARTVQPRFDLVRCCLRLLGPTTPALVGGYLDAPLADVKRRWPEEAVEVSVGGQVRWVLTDDDPGALGAQAEDVTRLLGPFDLFLQARDRELLVDDRARAKALWPTIGRPGAVLDRACVAGTWRPRKSGSTLSVAVDLWARDTKRLRADVEREAHRLAEFRGATLKEVTFG